LEPECLLAQLRLQFRFGPACRLIAMINYISSGCTAPILHVCQLKGSVIPKAIGWAVLSCTLSVMVNHNGYGDEELSRAITQTYFSYSFLLSFLVVFRTQSAYSRYWEGASTLNAIKGDFTNAASCMFAFCSTDPSKHESVVQFQHLIVRLMSLLHCAGLQSVATMKDEAFEVIDLEGLDDDSIAHLTNNPDDRTLIILQWIQKLVLEGMSAGVLPIAPPIASRLFQQLGQGVIQIAAAKKIADVPFPFPYTQMVTLLLFGSTLLTPVVVGLMIQQAYWAGLLTFVGIFGFWAINYIAAEIEMPFGDDANDLPIAESQMDFNQSLMVLMKPLTQTCPSFMIPEDLELRVKPCDIGIQDEEVGHAKTLSSQIHHAIQSASGIGNAIKHEVKHAERHLEKAATKVKITAAATADQAKRHLDTVCTQSWSACSSEPRREQEPRRTLNLEVHESSSPDLWRRDSRDKMLEGAHTSDIVATFTEAERDRLYDCANTIEHHLEKVSADMDNMSNLGLRLCRSMERMSSSMALSLSFNSPSYLATLAFPDSIRASSCSSVLSDAA